MIVVEVMMMIPVTCTNKSKNCHIWWKSPLNDIVNTRCHWSLYYSVSLHHATTHYTWRSILIIVAKVHAGNRADKKARKYTHTRVFQKKHFFEKMKSTTHHAIAWGLVWNDPKGFLILTKFRGASGHFRFDLFYIVDFHSAPIWPGWEWAEWKSII